MAAACLLWAAAWPGRAGLVDFSENLLAYVAKKWGREATPRLMVWQRQVRDNKAAGAAHAQDNPTMRQLLSQDQ